ncbi:MAG TPA: nitrate reductase cytochrome c-type subunit [Thiobacillaceae bacterium]|nr:nitrate reductase cytochrome c-type subunit [Thiobacillaceae bacterium]
MSKLAIVGAVMLAVTASLPACTSVSQEQKTAQAQTAVADAGIPDLELGLSKSSVFDDPSPTVFAYVGGDPGTNAAAETSYHTAPPMITHSIVDMVPILQDANLCKDCHVNPDLIGQKIDKGVPTPAPRSHYVENTNDLYMGRWNCTQCHRPQADVQPLVASTFIKDK